MVIIIWIIGLLVWVYVRLYWVFWINVMVIFECDVYGMFFFNENIIFYFIRLISERMLIDFIV